MSAGRIPLIGIVGGIGSGKTALAKALSDQFVCCVLDADAAGHRALARSDVKNELRTCFGNDVFDANGNVIRSEIAKQVFGNKPDQQAARRKLEQIVHPHIRRELLQQLEQLRAAKKCDLILLDAAILLEAGWSELCDAVVYVDAPKTQRLQRIKVRGWSEQDMAVREASQMPLEEKRRRADLIVDNSGSLDVAAEQLGQWIADRFQLVPETSATRVSP
jgi:dephospho-CoA kinase